MESDARSDLKLSGLGSVQGGVHRNVTVNGAGAIEGDLDCLDARLNGACEIQGRLKAETVRVSGAVKLGGEVTADKLRVDGTADVRGGASLRELQVGGALHLDGSLTVSEEAKVSGALTVKGDCNAETFTVRGSFSVQGLLNAGLVDVELYGESLAREIGGEHIRIRGGRGLGRFLRSLFPFAGQLETALVEGDEIALEYTRAKVVRGDVVELGAGCEVELVEYRTSLRLADGAVVRERRKI